MRGNGEEGGPYPVCTDAAESTRELILFLLINALSRSATIHTSGDGLVAGTLYAAQRHCAAPTQAPSLLRRRQGHLDSDL